MLEDLQGQIERITFHNDENGFTIARLKVKGFRELGTAVGNLMAPVPGQVLHLTGEWTTHSQFGEQFRIVRYKTLVPATVAGIEKYLGSGLVKGIGPVMADITLTPLPRWDLINMKLYASMSVQYSRGCPYDCEFCDIVNLNGRRPRVKSNDQMIREFEILYGMGWRGSLFIVDDNFIGNRSKVKTLLRELKPWQEAKGFPFILYTEASVNLAQDEELMRLMTAAGFDSVFLGLETPEEECLAECGKSQNRSMDLVEAVKTIQRNGMEVMGGFIIGFDNDPPDIFERQIKFIQNSGVVKAMIGLLNAPPGTRLYRRLKEEGRLLDDCSGDNCDGSMNFVPKMDPRLLREGYNAVLHYIYSPKEYYQRVLEFLRTYKPIRRRRITLSGTTAFLNSILYLGILDTWNNKIYYWKLLFKALMSYRQSLREAVALMIFGYHFRKLFRK
jgi:radical SAM superfamily enzyme YgiQ (UPF0313 family)